MSNKINIDQIKHLKQQLERKLLSSIKKFEDVTGMEVVEIDWRRNKELLNSTLVEITIEVKL